MDEPEASLWHDIRCMRHCRPVATHSSQHLIWCCHLPLAYMAYMRLCLPGSAQAFQNRQAATLEILSNLSDRLLQRCFFPALNLLRTCARRLTRSKEGRADVRSAKHWGRHEAECLLNTEKLQCLPRAQIGRPQHVSRLYVFAPPSWTPLLSQGVPRREQPEIQG